MRILFTLSLFVSLNVSAQTLGHRVSIDCGNNQPATSGILNVDFDTRNWTYTCKDLPRRTAYIVMTAPTVELTTSTDHLNSKNDYNLNSGFAMANSLAPANSCAHIQADYQLVGLHTLHTRMWQVQYGGRYPVSVLNQDGYMSLMLFELQASPSPFLSGSGTILSGNQTCNFKLAAGLL